MEAMEAKSLELHSKYPRYLPEATFQGVSEEMLISKDLQAQITCRICSGLYINPINLLCGHSFCKKCLMQSRIAECITCKKRYSKRFLPEVSSILTNLVNSQGVYCPSHFDKSTEPCHTPNLTVETVQAHVKECGNITLRCKCGKMIPRKNFLRCTVKCDCDFVDCKYCSIQQNERTVKLHSELCRKKAKIDCNNCGYCNTCKSKVANENDESFVSCPYSNRGCPARRLKMKEYRTHVVEGQAVHIMLELMQNYSEIYQNLATEIGRVTSYPQKLPSVYFQFRSRKYKLAIHPDEKIKNVVKIVFDASKEEMPETRVECWRVSPKMLLDLDLTFFDFDIQDNELLKVHVRENGKPLGVRL